MTDSTISPPSPLLRVLEARAGGEALSLLNALPLLRTYAPRGDGQPVLVLPGFMTGDTATWALRSFISSIGYRAHPWSQGINRGRMLDFLPPTLERIEQLRDAYGQPVRLVGWSRGGILARECSRDRPDLIDRVITMGSPIRGGAASSSIGWLVERETGLTPEQLQQLLDARATQPLTVPITAIYSRSDGVVAGEACIDPDLKIATYHEVFSSHSGMGAHPQVFWLVANALR